MHRSIQLEITVPASPQKVWTSWTTDEGIKSFFAPECCIDLKPGGKYEMYFDPEAETGSRGGEGCRILALDEPHFLSFTWNAPPSIPSLRNANQHTHVTIRIYADNEGGSLVQLTHDGFGDGHDWDQNFEYFEKAWGKFVLPGLLKSLKDGPIPWENS